jgi:hypothetical protein
MRPPWPSCCGPSCCPGPGSRHRPPAICGPCCAIGRPWCGCRPPARTGSTRCRPTAASARTKACGLVPGGPGGPPGSCQRLHGRSSMTTAGCWTPWPRSASRTRHGSDTRAIAHPDKLARSVTPGIAHRHRKLARLLLRLSVVMAAWATALSSLWASIGRTRSLRQLPGRRGRPAPAPAACAMARSTTLGCRYRTGPISVPATASVSATSIRPAWRRCSGKRRAQHRRRDDRKVALLSGQPRPGNGLIAAGVARVGS